MIIKPTHMLTNFYDALIPSSQLGTILVADYGVLPSLCPNCNHQITYSKLKLIIEYRPLYQILVGTTEKQMIYQ